MRLEGLHGLASSMRKNGIGRETFAFVLQGPNPIRFSVAFIIDETPWALVFGVADHNIAFEIPVHRGFMVSAGDISKDTWREILRLLGVQYNENDPFTRETFLLRYLDRNIPTAASRRNAYPHEIPRRMSVTDEAHKIYFVRWLPHGKNKRVTQPNLEKTKRYLGEHWAGACSSRNISSCWSAEPNDFKEPNAPHQRSGAVGGISD